ncbi:GBS Bsp-like repeat protein [compost metagenome]
MDSSYEIYAYGVKKDAQNVTFLTWTAYNGNDDLASPLVTGQKVTDGVWKAVVPFNKNKNETGLYYSDIWVDGIYFGGVTTVVKRNTVRIPEEVNLKSGSYEIIIEGIREDISKLIFYTWRESIGQVDLNQSGGHQT